MFCDPNFYRVLNDDVLPEFSKRPIIEIWLAGSLASEKAISMIILLKELNILDKSLIYSLDINPASIRTGVNGNFYSLI